MTADDMPSPPVDPASRPHCARTTLNPDALVALFILFGVVAALATTRIAPDAILAAGLTAVLAVPVPDASGAWQFGLLTPSEALRGFANPGVATVAVLFIVVTGLKETGGIDWLAQRVLGRPKSVRSALMRITFPVAGMSAFLNNTPVVAMLIPAVDDMARKIGISPSKLMIPLSYAAILGGTWSLIGTSTNLVVAGLVISSTDLQPLSMFDITRVGVPCAVVGIAFLLLLGPKLLPNKSSAGVAMSDPREYTLEMVVPRSSPLAGQTVEKAGLRNLPGCFLVEIERDGELLSGVGPEQVLRADDRLLFAGIVDSIKELQNLRGLAPATDQVFKLDAPRFRRRLFEAVVSPSSPAVGSTIRAIGFRNRYNGAVIAVARNGQRITAKVGDIEIRPGDVLLIEADPSFMERHRNSRDFLLVSGLEDSTPKIHAKAPLALVILIGMVVLATFGVVEMLVAAMIASGLLIVTRCCTVSSARRSVDWSVLVVIGAALAMGAALEKTGAASAAASTALALAGDNPWAALAVIYLVTMLTTEVVTNNAAVALVFPIAQATAAQLGVDFMPFVIAIMMAGSASFAMPLGYQTNLMVYGPGGYSILDFLKIGVPMNLLLAASCITITPMIFPF